MALELWILLILCGIGAVTAAVAWIRRKKRRAELPETGNNVYPLW